MDPPRLELARLIAHQRPHPGVSAATALVDHNAPRPGHVSASLNRPSSDHAAATVAVVSDSDVPDAVARPRTAAGVLLFDEADRVLLVKPTYKPGWEIPGGYLHPGETPSEGAAREVKEELGITPPIGRLLVADWAPHPTEGDKLLFVFDGGVLPADEFDRITVDQVEIGEHAFHTTDQLAACLIPRLARRVHVACVARAQSWGPVPRCRRRTSVEVQRREPRHRTRGVRARRAGGRAGGRDHSGRPGRLRRRPSGGVDRRVRFGPWMFPEQASPTRTG
nr:NUDIX hydrolase [Kitasatospora sp. A2-31]